MPGVTSTGFEAKTLEEIQTEINDALLENISPTLDVSSASIVGQVVGAVSSQIAQVWEAMEDDYASRDIDQAEDAQLDRLVAMRGDRRTGATYSTVRMTITLAAGTYAAGSLIVHVAGDPTLRFANDEEITTAGATLTDQPFTAETAGPVRANAGTLTSIANPVAGFSAPTNPAEAVMGEDAEDDATLRLRSNGNLARRGAHTVDAIRVDLLDLEGELGGVSFVRVVENDTDATVDSIPPHSIECIVLQDGASDQEVAEAIFAAKGAGIYAYGTTSGQVADEQGNLHTVGFTKPTQLTIYMDIQLTVLDGGRYAGNTAVKQAITDWCDENLSVGVDVIKARIEAICLGVSGVLDAAVEIGLSAGAGTVASNYVVGSREIAIVDQANIAVSRTEVSGAP